MIFAAQSLRRVGPEVFPGLTANPQQTRGPSLSLRLLAARHSVGPRFPGLTDNPQHTLDPSWSVLAAGLPPTHLLPRNKTFDGIMLPHTEAFGVDSEDVAVWELVDLRQEQHFRAAGSVLAPTVRMMLSGGATTLVLIADGADAASSLVMRSKPPGPYSRRLTTRH